MAPISYHVFFSAGQNQAKKTDTHSEIWAKIPQRPPVIGYPLTMMYRSPDFLTVDRPVALGYRPTKTKTVFHVVEGAKIAYMI